MACKNGFHWQGCLGNINFDRVLRPSENIVYSYA